jgi:sphinganine-1-phosphate aldolase
MFNNFSAKINQSLSDYTPTQILLGAWIIPIGLYLYNRNWKRAARRLQDLTFKTLPKIPYIGAIFTKELDKKFGSALDDIDADIHKHRTLTYTELPAKGINPETLIAQLQSDSDSSKLADQMSGSIYRMSTNGFELDEMNAKIFELSAYTNPLHPGAWPNIEQREAEVIRWCAQLYHGDDSVCGNITNGGTFSIMEACRAHKIWAEKEKGITQPNMVVPSSVHAAFDKAAQDYGIELIKVPVDPITQRANVKAMAKKINRNTIMLVGSAPSFPTGAMDPIKELSDLALSRGIGLHVDACLGGFLIPFAEEAGYPLPLFDFRLPGVTSISLDAHKYAQAPKGSSVVLFLDFIGKYQTYVFLDSGIGFYITPNQAGSRSGANILMTWATLLRIGRSKYVEMTQAILELKNTLRTELEKIPEITLLGKSDLSVIGFSSSIFNIYLLSEKMHDLGWHLNNIQDPAGFHLCLTAKHLEDPNFAQRFLKDFTTCVEEIKLNPNQKPKGEGAVYGMKAKIPAFAPQLKEKLGREYQYLSNRTHATRRSKPIDEHKSKKLN